MERRQFLTLPLAGMTRGGLRLETGPDGRVLSLKKGSMELVDPRRDGAPRVTGPARVELRSELIELDNGTALRQTVRVPFEGAGAVRAEIPRNVRLPSEKTELLLPLKNGVLRRAPASQEAAFEFAGGSGGGNLQEDLAIPLVHAFAPESGVRVSWAADVTFSTGFGESFVWEYPEGVARGGEDLRTLYTIVHSGGFEQSMRAFYATALREIPPGPEWLHDVAMVGYDYLSEGGKGWFADIDMLEKLIAPRDRRKVLLALHGWYDYVGLYTFDSKSRSLARRWTAFPNAQGPEVQRRAELPDTGNPFHWAAEKIRALRPVEMTLEDMHRRIQYARRRGFRVALYFADGLMSSDGIPGFDPSRVLRWGGWMGPETKGKSFVMNPLHPEVAPFFRGYLRALLEEYGREVDAFVWDETFYVQPWDAGAGEYRGFAARAMRDTVQELTRMTSAHSRELAFLTSDNLIDGPRLRHRAPYALSSHGTYQDSGCNREYWKYGLFPNYRNTLWSCNWAPMKAFDRTEYGVNTFDVPVAISNGYGEDLGVSEMSREQVARLMGLFEKRKTRRMQIGWLEERGGQLQYQGRAV